MKVPETSLLINLADFLLRPFMWVLGGFRFPIQETHHWHGVDIEAKSFSDKKGILINYKDKKARFGHDAPFGLFHMPIFGGLKRYVIVTAKGFKKHWHIVWKHGDSAQIHRLKIFSNKLMFLTGKDKYFVFGVDEKGNLIKLKIFKVGYLGDSNYNKNLKLF